MFVKLKLKQPKAKRLKLSGRQLWQNPSFSSVIRITCAIYRSLEFSIFHRSCPSPLIYVTFVPQLVSYLYFKWLLLFEVNFALISLAGDECTPKYECGPPEACESYGGTMISKLPWLKCPAGQLCCDYVSWLNSLALVSAIFNNNCLPFNYEFVSRKHLVQSLNYLFHAPYIGVESHTLLYHEWKREFRDWTRKHSTPLAQWLYLVLWQTSVGWGCKLYLIF